jgi:site-specific DNA recombinase
MRRVHDDKRVHRSFRQAAKEDALPSAPPAAVTAVEPGLRAVTYMRVSSDAPVKTDSKDAQRVKCQRKAEQLGLTIIDGNIDPERAVTEKSV